MTVQCTGTVGVFLKQSTQLNFVCVFVAFTLCANLFHSDLTLELPFTLTHPKPADSPDNSRPGSAGAGSSSGGGAGDRSGDTSNAADTDLIQLDPKSVTPHCNTMQTMLC